MSQFPNSMQPITIVMTVCFFDKERRKVAQQALKSWDKNLIYDGELHLHIADDGSLLELDLDRFWTRSEITHSYQKAQGVGASLNAGFKEAYKTSPLILYAVDDWKLQQPFDITPWAYLLEQREDVGIVRLGPPHPHLSGNIEPMTELWQGWALRLNRFGLVVGHRPEIFHKRMTDYYGFFDEQVNAQECERLYSVRWAADDKGPGIALALPHPWFHIDQKDLPSTSHIEPKDRINES